MDNTRKNFLLLQLAIGARAELGFVPDEADWQRFFNFCERQALLGIGFAAVERMHGQGVACPSRLRLGWLSIVLQIERRNRTMNDACRRVGELFARDGFASCVLKGQGNLLCYPEQLRLRRQSGDIDIWVRRMDGSKEGTGLYPQGRGGTIGRREVEDVVDYAVRHGADGSCLRYHHVDARLIDGVETEVHFRVGHFSSPLRNRRLQRWFDPRFAACAQNRSAMGFAVPLPRVNAVYQMAHLFTHYLDEGLGLRQLLDYCFLLQAEHEAISASSADVFRTMCRLGMGRFAAAVMWVLGEVLALPATYYICSPDEREGRRLLAEIMAGGNFGQFDQRGRSFKTGGLWKHGLWKLRRVLRLVGSYPEEALCEPFFRVWHYFWRRHLFLRAHNSN